MDDDDTPQLSASTFAALQEFYAEQNKREEILNKLKIEGKLKDNIVFEENWQLSQFWYDEDTIKALVGVAKNILPSNGLVALISCPTLFIPMKRQLKESNTVTLLEYDRRFEVHKSDFVFYDYNYPEKIPKSLEKAFDLVLADPPFLSEDCLKKTSKTVKLLAKDKIIFCTGSVMEETIKEVLGLHKCLFEPRHRNNLANEFSCYANFDFDSHRSRTK